MLLKRFSNVEIFSIIIYLLQPKEKLSIGYLYFFQKFRMPCLKINILMGYWVRGQILPPFFIALNPMR